MPLSIIAIAPNQPQPRILIVDDRELNRELLFQILQPLGFAVSLAIDGNEAISAWQSWQPDLILMDLRMLHLSGERAIEIIKSDRTTTKIIASTASSLETERVSIMALGCDDFLRKPFKTDELLLMMTKYLGVCYTYAGNTLDSPLPLLTLNYQAFEEISHQLLLELQQSIMAIDLAKIEQITQQIAQENELLAQTIEQYISNFEYEHILNLLPFN